MAAAVILIALYALVVALLGLAGGSARAQVLAAPARPVVIAATGVAAVACIPVPIHGGFILLGPVLARETWSEWRRARAVTAEMRRDTRLDRRFAG